MKNWKKFIKKNVTHHPIGEKIPSDFDPEIYLDLNPDVKNAGCDPFVHYIEFGIKENRSYKQTNEEAILDLYIQDYPKGENAFKIFEHEWSSFIPDYGFGKANLFQDDRIRMFIRECGGLEGKNILELGPLEGAHSFMLSNAGAKKIISIESNVLSFLKCLIVKNHFKFNVDFVLGDFNKYLNSCTEKFDLVVASGVLYHMTDPINLLFNMCKVSDAVGIWTQYYDEDVISGRGDLSKKFNMTPVFYELNFDKYPMYKQSYLNALNWAGFCGGGEPISYWLTKETIVAILEKCDMTITELIDDKFHQNGPALTLYARKK